MVELLISRGADINARTEEGLSPHDLAVHELGRDHLITQFLEEKGADTSKPGLYDDAHHVGDGAEVGNGRVDGTEL
jgi:ankyrin repeat protein